MRLPPRAVRSRAWVEAGARALLEAIATLPDELRDDGETRPHDAADPTRPAPARDKRALRPSR
jgi:hypothetical protein